MDLYLLTSCIDDIKTRILDIEKIVMSGNEDSIDWDKVKYHGEQIQEQVETMLDEIYEYEE